MKDLKNRLMWEDEMGTMLHAVRDAIQERPRAAKPTVYQAQSGQRAATSARPGSNGPSERGGPEQAWIRNTCHFSLGLRKLFILFSPDCFIWQILGEMASSFPRVLEAACLFLQLAVLQVGVTGSHIEAWCHWWAYYVAEIQGLGRVSWMAGRPGPGMATHFPPTILMATVCSSAKEPSEVLLPHCALKVSKSTVNLLLIPPASTARVFINTTSSLKPQCSRATPISLFHEMLSLRHPNRVTRCP